MELSLEGYSSIHVTMSGHRLLGYLISRELYDQIWNMAVVYNNATAQRKEEAHRRCEARFVTGIQKIKESYERTRGRPLSYGRAQTLAAALAFPPYQSVFRYTIAETPPTPRLERGRAGEGSDASSVRQEGVLHRSGPRRGGDGPDVRQAVEG